MQNAEVRSVGLSFGALDIGWLDVVDERLDALDKHKSIDPLRVHQLTSRAPALLVSAPKMLEMRIYGESMSRVGLRHPVDLGARSGTRPDPRRPVPGDPRKGLVRDPGRRHRLSARPDQLELLDIMAKDSLPYSLLPSLRQTVDTGLRPAVATSPPQGV